MIVIYKYPLTIPSTQVAIPNGGAVLSVGTKSNELYIWLLSHRLPEPSGSLFPLHFQLHQALLRPPALLHQFHFRLISLRETLSGYLR